MALARLTRPATTGLLLLGAALLCGLRLPAEGERTLAFEAFGFVEGVLALLVLFLFLRQGVLRLPGHWSERLILAYWFGATAVLLRLGLPPPGLGYWVGTAILAAALLGAFGGDDRRRSLFTLGIALAICGMLRFALIPFVWRNATLPDLGPLDLGGISDWVKGLVTDYQPVRQGNEVLNVAGIALYALAVWRSWPELDHDPLAGLGREERERLLRILVQSGLEARPALEAPSRLESPRPTLELPPGPELPPSRAPEREPGPEG
jgi:hypothetical protein